MARAGTWGTWLAALGRAVLLPPLGVWLARRRGPAVRISLLGCGAAVGAFLVMAGAGVALWGPASVSGRIRPKPGAMQARPGP